MWIFPAAAFTLVALGFLLAAAGLLWPRGRMVTPAASAVPCLPGGGGWPPIPASPAGSLHAEREAEGILVLLGLLRLSSDPLPGSGPYPPGGYWLTRIVFLRFLGSIYFIAFFSLSHQIEPLIGQNGILPARAYLDRVAAATGEGVAAWKAVPSLFWADASDETLVAAARAGTGLSLLLLAGFDNAVLLALLWVLYSSLVNVGQLFYGYGWEMLLLETGFLAIFLCPVRRGVLLPEGRAPSPAVMFLIRWVLFRVMFGAGLIKIRGDECWRDLTCLVYHYETQPLPNPLSWYLHQMPPFIHKLGVLWNHFIELIVPFFLFGPRRVRIAGGLLLIAFQATLILSGNLSWLNWLTISLCIPCLDDRALQFLFTRRFLRRVEAAQSTGGRGLAARIAVALLALLVLYLSINPVLNLISPQQRMNASFDPFHLVNTYGAFGHIGKQRFEIILEGTAEESITPSTVWLPYEFKCKPGDVTRRPCVVAPYHYRLDWQIWFAAMSEYRRQPWLMHFTYKLLQGDRGVLGLLAGNPFPDRPPKFIRAELYLYQFTTFEERSRAWWKRTRVGEYFSPVSLDNPWFLKFLQAYGWGR